MRRRRKKGVPPSPSIPRALARARLPAQPSPAPRPTPQRMCVSGATQKAWPGLSKAQPSPRWGSEDRRVILCWVFVIHSAGGEKGGGGGGGGRGRAGGRAGGRKWMDGKKKEGGPKKGWGGSHGRARTHAHPPRPPPIPPPPAHRSSARASAAPRRRAGGHSTQTSKEEYKAASALKPRRKGESSTSGHCECVLRNGPTLAELSSRSVCARGRAGVRARGRRRIDRWEGKKKRKGGGACFSLVGWVAPPPRPRSRALARLRLRPWPRRVRQAMWCGAGAAAWRGGTAG